VVEEGSEGEAMIPNHPTALAMLATVAAVYGLDAKDLAGRERWPTIVEARHLAWWLLREKTGWSYPELGRALGVDHTSVLNGVRKTAAKVLGGLGTPSLKVAIKVCAACEEVEALPPDKPGTSHGVSTEQPEAKPVNVAVFAHIPPAAPRALSPLSSGSDSSPDSSSLLSSGSEGPVSKPAREPKPPKPRGWKVVPAEWVPNDDHRKRARELRVNFDEELQKFREHEFKDPKQDFDRAFSRWLRRSVEFKATGVRASPGGGSTVPMLMARVQRLEAEGEGS
jgi:hypothetical protein